MCGCVNVWVCVCVVVCMCGFYNVWLCVCVCVCVVSVRVGVRMFEICNLLLCVSEGF